MQRGPAKDAPNRLQRWLLCSAPVWFVYVFVGQFLAVFPTVYFVLRGSGLRDLLILHSILSVGFTVFAAFQMMRSRFRHGRADREVVYF